MSLGSVFKRIFGKSLSIPFKVQDVNSKKRVGIVASSYLDLVKKGSQKLGLTDVVRVVLEEDGSEVDSDAYLSKLPPQTVLVFLLPGDVWEGCISYLKMASSKIIDNISLRKCTVEKIQEILCDPESPELTLLMEFVNVAKGNPDVEKRLDDPEWFEGVSNSYKTKVQTMRNSAQGRVRKYMLQAKEFAVKTQMSKSDRTKLNKIFENFYALLKEKKYFGEYFDRSSVENDCSSSLCTEKGWFGCQGAYDECHCKQKHTINPYSTKDARVLFSTWNLDHQIEKSRTVLPCLMDSLKNCPRGKDVNWKYFFDLLFTLGNLKLVDIRCHKKTAHTSCVVDTDKIYVASELKSDLTSISSQVAEESETRPGDLSSNSSDEEWNPDFD